MSTRTIALCRTAAIVAVLQLATTTICGEQPESAGRLVVHEWGTFTCLHDERGNAIGGINSDDEPVPEFVHRISRFLLVPGRVHVPALYQGAPRCHPDVTMRLETPVVYFHPAPGSKLPLELNLDVAFNGGWLSEYYPHADVEAPGVKAEMSFGPINKRTIGRLAWNDLQVGTAAEGPETKLHVWLAPRAVDAVNVTAYGGESERFLFYRGVGHIDSPLRVSRSEDNRSLTITANFPIIKPKRVSKFAVPSLWLVDIQNDKSCAFRRLDGFEVPNDGRSHVVTKTPANFEDEQYDAANLSQLNNDLRTALIDDGLFADEADALVNTWRVSYFESPGLRLFYLLPRMWTDHVLPINASIDADVVRTMIGRVEIVTPKQRVLLKRIAAGPASNARWLQAATLDASANRPAEPADYQAYSDLGRFRNSLVLDELNRQSTPALKSFVEGYGLHGYVVGDTDDQTSDDPKR